MTDLLDAVDALTQPIKSKVVQEKGGITCTSPVELPSLLVQLDNAIRSSMGGSTSGASLAFEGAPLNTAALFEAIKITSQIEQWCRGVKVIATRKPADDLRAWYVATLARTEELEVETFHIKQLGTWAHTIESLLDPPRQKDLPDPCPACGATEWWDPKTKAKYYRPLIIRYRPEDEANATALCRFCAQTWNARELAFAIEEAERHADAEEVTGSA
jgi:hypothetical protein